MLLNDNETFRLSHIYTVRVCKANYKKKEKTKEVNVSNVDIGKQSPPPKRWKSCENKCLKLKAVIDRKGRDSEKGREEQKEKK